MLLIWSILMINKLKRIHWHLRFGVLEIIQSGLYSQGILKENLAYLKREKYYTNLAPEKYEAELKDWLKSLNFNDDISNPQTFNGKIQWLKIHDILPIKTKLADKYAVREWVEKEIGAQYLIPIIAVWDKVEDIDISLLPEQFVLKSTTGSGRNYIVRDKSKCNWDDIKKTLNLWQKYSFGWDGFELQYINIPRKIIAEQYIEQIDGNLYDYKIHCFHGEPKLIQVIGDRNLEEHTGKANFYSIEWEKTALHCRTYNQYEKDIPKPNKLSEMLNLARILSKDFKYVRVDLYNINEDIKFGEMTFTPANGMDIWGGESFEEYNRFLKITDE